jgi:hypothetical protein
MYGLSSPEMDFGTVAGDPQDLTDAGMVVEMVVDPAARVRSSSRVSSRDRRPSTVHGGGKFVGHYSGGELNTSGIGVIIVFRIA